MKDGILVLNKPQNWTSHDCVAVCRSVLGIKKIGHGGTLDPMACGVLPVFIGRATRIMEYTELDEKTYRCTARLGLTTDTQDIWGTVLEQHDMGNLSAAAVGEALQSFRGELEQIPPKYSALKVKGKKLYEYAREGMDVEIKPRKVRISSLREERIDLDRKEVSFEVTCSKGTYIRTICSDLGERLGCGAVMSALTRTASGVFHLEGAINAEKLKEMECCEIEKQMLPVDVPLVHFGRILMHKDRAGYFCSGNAIRWNQVKVLEEPEIEAGDGKNGRGRDYCRMYKVYRIDTGEFLGIGYCNAEKKLLEADKIFMAK